ncbi:hypothetical protein Tco_1078498 [Tanacetum coccineum]|uniref:CCHC-type domain-containing protein n=1 Tax=Tanacetum coccineum TaxID=301880 RepID=A0ABQ5HP79_9ASTR
MPPKRTTTTTTAPMTNAAIKQLIAQGVADALAEIEANRTSRNGDDNHDSGTGSKRTERAASKCTYIDFLKCQPLNFKGNEGVVSLTQWFKKMESVFHISNCTVACQIKFATCTLLGSALTWWNSYVKTVKGTDVVSYTQCFQELELMCGRMFPEESDEVEKYKIRTFAERQAENKRKLDNDNQTQQQPPKKQNMAITYTVGSGKRKEYVGTLPLCNKCKFHHTGPCTVKCANCNRIGHLTRDCRSPATTNNQRTLTCYECGNHGHYRSECPELKNRNHGNQAGGAEARGMVYALGGRDTDQDIDDMEDDINA